MKSLVKVKDILYVVARDGGATLSELARMLAQPKSTVYRLLRALEAGGFVTRSENGLARYELGGFVRSLVRGDNNTDQLVAVANPSMIRLRDGCNETVALHILQARRWIAVHQVESTQELRRTFTNIGDPMPLHAGAPGKVFLAYMPAPERQLYFKENELRGFTPNTITNRRRLMTELERISNEGYAISFQEAAIGVAGICMPIHNPNGIVESALGVSGPISRFTPKTITAIRDRLKKSVVRIEHELGSERSNTMNRRKGTTSLQRGARHKAARGPKP